MTCKQCGRKLRDKDNKYRSTQHGMEGEYHWTCFVRVCREANRIGNQVLENNIQSTGNLHSHAPTEMF
jgi:hypothetical protein